MCLKKLKGFISRLKDMLNIVFHKLTRHPVEELDLRGTDLVREKPRKKWWHFPLRFIETSRGGINMPKYQGCPDCVAHSKRVDKTLGGANYSCRTHGSFFVRGKSFSVTP